MSDFIERSKHPGLTAMVESHIMGGAMPDATGMSPAQTKGYNGRNALPGPAQDCPFNTPDTGVNYLSGKAGHKV